MSCSEHHKGRRFGFKLSEEMKRVSSLRQKEVAQRSDVQAAMQKTQFKKGQKPWNYGLTKETDIRVAKYGTKESITIAMRGRLPPMQGKKHTIESKEKNRLTHLGRKDSIETIERKRQAQNTPQRKQACRLNMLRSLKKGIVGWQVSGHWRGENYPERQFRLVLESYGLERNVDFVQEYHIEHFWVDFAIPEYHCIIEIDGPQHITDKGRAKDQMRDTILASLGWKVFRIPVKELKTIKELKGS